MQINQIRIIRIAFVYMLACLFVGCNPQPSSISDLPAGSPTQGIVFVSTRDGNEEIYRMNATGDNVVRLTNNAAVDSEPSWSPTGTQIAFRSRQDGSSDIFVIDPDGKTALNLINDPEDSFDDEFYPRWHPAGDRLAIYTDRPPPPGCTAHTLAMMTLLNGPSGITKSPTSAETFTWTPDGEQILAATRCTSDESEFYTWNPGTNTLRRFHPIVDLPFVGNPAFSPDGNTLAFQATVDGNNIEIFLLDLGSGETQQLTNHPARDIKPTWSPDGNEIAFVTNRDGNDEIYVMNVNGGDIRNLTNHPARDDWPHWSPVP